MSVGSAWRIMFGVVEGREVVLTAVAQRGWALEYAWDELPLKLQHDPFLKLLARTKRKGDRLLILLRVDTLAIRFVQRLHRLREAAAQERLDAAWAEAKAGGHVLDSGVPEATARMLFMLGLEAGCARTTRAGMKRARGE